MKISKPQLQQLVQEVIQEGYWKEKEDAYMELKNLMDEYGLGVDDLEALVEQLKLDVGDYPGEGEEDDTHWGADTEMTVGGTKYHLKKDDDEVKENIERMIREELATVSKEQEHHQFIKENEEDIDKALAQAIDLLDDDVIIAAGSDEKEEIEEARWQQAVNVVPRTGKKPAGVDYGYTVGKQSTSGDRAGRGTARMKDVSRGGAREEKSFGYYKNKVTGKSEHGDLQRLIAQEKRDIAAQKIKQTEFAVKKALNDAARKKVPIDNIKSKIADLERELHQQGMIDITTGAVVAAATFALLGPMGGIFLGMPAAMLVGKISSMMHSRSEEKIQAEINKAQAQRRKSEK